MKERRINLRFPEEIFLKLENKRVIEGMTFQAIGDALFHRWLGQESMLLPRNLTADERRLVRALLKFLREAGNERLRVVLEGILIPATAHSKKNEEKGRAG